jgi:hypothetical protein
MTKVAAANYAMNAQSLESLVGYTATTGTGQRVELPVAVRVLAGKTVVVADVSGSASTANPINIARFGYGIGGTDLVNGTDIIGAIKNPYGIAVAVSDGANKWSVSYSSQNVYSGTATLNITSLATLTTSEVLIPVPGVTTTSTPSISYGLSGTLPNGLVEAGKRVVTSGTVGISFYNTAGLSVSSTLTIRASVAQP